MSMQICRREAIQHLSMRVVDRPHGYFAVIHDEARPTVVVLEYLSKDFDHAMRRVDREIYIATGQYLG